MAKALLAILFTAWLAGPAAAQPGAPPLNCQGAFAQGGIVVCRTTPGAALIVDGVERGAADEAGLVVLGFDRDAKPLAVIAVRDKAGRIATKTAQIAKREFQIQRVSGLPPRTVNPSQADMAKIARDKQWKAKAGSSRWTVPGFMDGFIWPVKGPISGPWGAQRILNGEPRQPHYGVDIAAPAGSPVVAPAAGIVTLAQSDMHFEGGFIMIDHGQGLISYYLHLSRVDVREGQRVAQGSQLGLVGATGRATGPHLCWRLRWRDRQLDPSLAIDGLAMARQALFNPVP